MTSARAFYAETTPEKCAAEVAALPDELRSFLQATLGIKAPTPAASPFPAYLVRIEFGGRCADMAIDIALLALAYESGGIVGVIQLIAAEMVAFWEGIEIERKALN